MSEPFTALNRQAAADLEQALRAARARHVALQQQAAAARRPIRVRIHGAAVDWIDRASRVETTDPDPPASCACPTCLAYIRRTPT